MKKKFSVQDILEFNPCSGYTEERITELFKSVGCKKYITVDKLFKVNIPHQDFFWLILRNDFISEKELHMIAIWCFERIAQPIWEKYYPDDKRPQDAIKVKKLWLKGKATIEELDAAWPAAWDAARDAAWDAAGYAARAAAWDAARPAAWDAARAAAWAAARDAARAAARDAAMAAAWDAAWAAAWDAAWDAARNAARGAQANQLRVIVPWVIVAKLVKPC